jgi:H+-transporting ATPase
VCSRLGTDWLLNKVTLLDNLGRLKRSSKNEKLENFLTELERLTIHHETIDGGDYYRFGGREAQKSADNEEEKKKEDSKNKPTAKENKKEDNEEEKQKEDRENKATKESKEEGEESQRKQSPFIIC